MPETVPQPERAGAVGSTRLVLRPGPRAKQLLWNAHLLAVQVACCQRWIRQDVATEYHTTRRAELIAKCREMRVKAFTTQNGEVSEGGPLTKKCN